MYAYILLFKICNILLSVAIVILYISEQELISTNLNLDYCSFRFLCSVSDKIRKDLKTTLITYLKS